MKLRFLLWTVSLLMFVSCACGTGDNQVKATGTAFPSVDVPVVFQNDYRQVARFLTENFWDRFFDPSREWTADTSLVCGVKKSDFVAAIRDYAFVLNSHISDPLAFSKTFPQARASLESLLSKASELQDSMPGMPLFGLLTAGLESNLYNPNSPYRNEDLYEVVAGFLSESPLVDEYVRGRYAYEKQMCGMNRTGMKAADFNYLTDSGKKGNLHSIESEYTIMFFSNPGCEACRQIVDQLTLCRLGNNGEGLDEMIGAGVISVLNIYIDTDYDAWRSYLGNYPDNWVNACNPDGELRSETLYSIRAIPSLYLLDRGKRVLFKDAVPEKVIAYLQSVI